MEAPVSMSNETHHLVLASLSAEDHQEGRKCLQNGIDDLRKKYSAKLSYKSIKKSPLGFAEFSCSLTQQR